MTQSTKSSQANGVERLKRFVEGNILWLLCGAYVFAACWPSAGLAIRETTVGSQPLTLALLAALLFLAGLSIDSRDVAAARQSGWLVLTGQAILWGTPLLVVALLAQFSGFMSVSTLAGLGLVALMPAAASSVAWSQLGNGNMAVSVSVLVTSTLLCPLVILAAGEFGIVAGGHIDGRTGGKLATLVAILLPTVFGGMLVRRALGREKVGNAAAFIKLAMTAILLLLNYANASLALPDLIRSPNAGSILSTIVATGIVCIAGFVVGYAVARYARVGHEILWPFMLGVGMKNTGMALVLAGIVLEDKPLAIFAVLIFTLMQHLACGICFRIVPRTKHAVPAEN